MRALQTVSSSHSDSYKFSHMADILLSGDHPENYTKCAPPETVFHAVEANSPLSDLPAGPFFAQLSHGFISVYKAYRVYSDPAGAFYYGVIQDQSGAFEVLSSTSPLTNGGATVAVPSRLYYAAPSPELPLSGVRIGVKDLYDLDGLKTSAGSRAYHSLYAPATKTAESIQILLDLGAVVIGKTRTSQFANGQAPTADWVDFHDPFNARGDGYQDPSSSSAGAGSAQSNYDWVDMNIGSDTGGSVRAPAAVSGVFGNRPSQDIMTLEGVVPLSAYMDTPAFVASSAAEFAAYGRAWYGAGNSSLQDYDAFPTRLIYPIDTPGINTTEIPSPGFFPFAEEAAADLFEQFTSGLERVVNTKRETLDFYTAYKEQSGTDLYPVEHLGEVWTLMTSYEQANGVLADLVSDYMDAHDGDLPYFDPPIALNRQYGLNLTEAEFEEALTNKTIFKDWLETELLAPELDTAYCSSALLIHPIWGGVPSYRDNYPSGDPTVSAPVWNQYSISQLGGVPEVVLPLGEVNYTSRVTETTKYLPVAVSINAAAGCDLMLYRLVEVLAEEGVIPSKVGTGQSLGAVFM